jgi:hypothetical protein
MSYKKTVAETIRDLFKDNFGDQFRTYRIGDPIEIGESMLPAIFVTESSVSFAQDATGYDEISHNIVVQVVLNKKDDLGRPDDGNTLDLELDNLLYGRDKTTGLFLDNSVVGLIRKNLTLGNLSVDIISDIRKEFVIRPEERVTVEANVELTVTELQPVGSRQ